MTAAYALLSTLGPLSRFLIAPLTPRCLNSPPLPLWARRAAPDGVLAPVPSRAPRWQTPKVMHEVDSALQALVEREAIGTRDVDVVFDAPTKDWAERRNSPTVDIYLYDIREDLRRRVRGLINEYSPEDVVVARHLPARHFKLSYLITAWTQRPEDEHRLLSSLLTCFLRFEAIPTDLLEGSLAELDLPVPMTIGLPPPEDRSFADVWSALGGELKPSLDLVVSAPIDTGQRFTAGPPVLEETKLSIEGIEGWPPQEMAEHHRPSAGRQAMRRNMKPGTVG